MRKEKKYCVQETNKRANAKPGHHWICFVDFNPLCAYMSHASCRSEAQFYVPRFRFDKQKAYDFID